MSVTLLLVWASCFCSGVAGLIPSWTSVPVHAPPYLAWASDPDNPHYPWHYVNVQIGSPPQAQRLSIGLSHRATLLYAPNCTICPNHNKYDPSLSESGQMHPGFYKTKSFEGPLRMEDVQLGTFESIRSTVVLVDFMNIGQIFRPREGVLGLLNHPANKSVHPQNFLQKLFDSGNLLNPVVGLKLGGPNASMSIGALDPSHYEGEINWVQVPSYANGSSLMEDGAEILVEAVRGWNGNMMSLPYPIRAGIDTAAQSIQLLNYLGFMENSTLLGPGATFLRPPKGLGYFKCSTTWDNLDFSGINVPFSVDINGVNYPVETDDLVKPMDPRWAQTELCISGIMNLQIPSNYSILLGLPFLRSVYLAYRFPTEDCPIAHYGFAFPRGASRRKETLEQKPRTTSMYGSQCLNLTPPTSSPSPLAATSTPITKPGDRSPEKYNPGDKTWKVYGFTNKEVLLKGTEDLPELVERPGQKLLSWSILS